MPAEVAEQPRSERGAPPLHHTLFPEIRKRTLELCAPLTPEDMMVQSCAEASPAKWHLAHTTWFFETFLLREFLPGYREFHPDFRWLFNSYYNAVGDQPEKKLRASFSRPALAEVLAYREHVDRAMSPLAQPGISADLERRVVLGLHHEQQHQELLCYDIKHAFWSNPLHPAYAPGDLPRGDASAPPLRWIRFEGGLREIGHDGEGFAFDNESPRHLQFLEPFVLAARPVSCADFLAFMEDGGYRRPELWLSEGWETMKREAWEAPLYWRRAEGGWGIFTLRGFRRFEELAHAPVCHVSYFEADAYARWAGHRLPTEAEWEIAAVAEPVGGNLLDSGWLHPIAPELQARMEDGRDGDATGALQQIFGDVWEWTASPYVGYPGYRALPGALGEYNGKFMCNQMVLRGGSAVTPASHIRATYRNFFAPSARWQFAGFRLAADAS